MGGSVGKNAVGKEGLRAPGRSSGWRSPTALRCTHRVIRERIGAWIWFYRHARDTQGNLLMVDGDPVEIVSREQMAHDFRWRTTSFVYQMETAHRGPGHGLVAKLSLYFGVDPASFFLAVPPEVLCAMRIFRGKRGRPPKNTTRRAG